LKLFDACVRVGQQSDRQFRAAPKLRLGLASGARHQTTGRATPCRNFSISVASFLKNCGKNFQVISVNLHNPTQLRRGSGHFVTVFALSTAGTVLLTISIFLLDLESSMPHTVEYTEPWRNTELAPTGNLVDELAHNTRARGYGCSSPDRLEEKVRRGRTLPPFAR